MNKTQKAALYGFFLVGFLLLIPLFDLLDSKINPILLRAIGYPLAVLMVLPVWFLSRKHKQNEVDIDERDKKIVNRALLISGGLVGIGLLVFYVILLFYRNPGDKIKISSLPVVVFFAFIAFLVILSSAVLIQYGWGGKGEK